MGRVLAVLAVTSVSLVALSAQPVESPANVAATTDRPPTFQSGIDVVALPVTVTGKRTGFVPNLTRDDFEVFQDGAPQDVTLFDSGNGPIDIAVLLDSSGSVGDRFELVRAAARNLFGTLRQQDRGAVVAFNESVRILSDWTRDRAALDAALEAARPGGGTALYTAIYVSLRSLAGPRGASYESDGAVRRQALVVLSDGKDTSSLLSFDDVLEVVRGSAVGIYTVRLVRPVDDAVDEMLGRRNRQDAAYVMNALARETGARAFSVSGLEMLKGTYGQIAEELANQYVLGFVPRPGVEPKDFHTVRVAVRGRSDLQARTRTGYLDSVVKTASVASARSPQPVQR